MFHKHKHIVSHCFGITFRVSNSLDPDQARRYAGLIWVITVCNCDQQHGPYILVILDMCQQTVDMY